MNRLAFKKTLGCSEPAVLPVIHVLDNDQALRNAKIAKEAGCPGVFLINHDFAYPTFLPIIQHVRQALPDYWIGVNFLAVTGKIAFPILSNLEKQGTTVNAYWADDARIDEKLPIDQQTEAQEILQIKNECGWNGLYFGGTAFKKQREVHPDHYQTSAAIASQYMDVVTTSGIATGHSVDHPKMAIFRQACADHPLALASGITPDNITDYLPSIDAVLVATGINFNNDFYNIDPEKLTRLLHAIQR